MQSSLVEFVRRLKERRRSEKRAAASVGEDGVEAALFLNERAHRHQPFGGGEADATRTARNERHSSCEFSVHARVFSPECAGSLGAERVRINRLITIS
jgi:hypothetical protein